MIAVERRVQPLDHSRARMRPASSSSMPITMRSGRMKSSTAAPSFRNSGFDTTEKPCCARRVEPARRQFFLDHLANLLRRADRHRRLVDDHLEAIQWRPMLRAASSTYCRSAEPSSSGGVPTAMNWISPCSTLASTSVENWMRPAGARALQHFLQAGFVDRHAAFVEDIDLARIDVDDKTRRCRFRQDTRRSPDRRIPYRRW